MKPAVRNGRFTSAKRETVAWIQRWLKTVGTHKEALL
jgi:hypothetical protein